MAELVDAADSKSAALKSVSVRLRPRAPLKSSAYLRSPLLCVSGIDASDFQCVILQIPAADALTQSLHIKSAADVPASAIRIGRRQARESTFALKAQSSELLRPVSSRLTDTPAVMVIGSRQFGKPTLARELVDGERPYLTLDNQTTHPRHPNSSQRCDPRSGSRDHRRDGRSSICSSGSWLVCRSCVSACESRRRSRRDQSRGPSWVRCGHTFGWRDVATGALAVAVNLVVSLHMRSEL